ncbi:MAG TPA: alpha-L-arabinofuranosidase C-terminal domain-containing protein [Bryobacteraceae bacterium]|nr:alpha-L-arabinofuranosidase C-terminal domain-containing protein [Bryobacteraceae bacterium]
MFATGHGSRRGPLIRAAGALSLIIGLVRAAGPDVSRIRVNLDRPQVLRIPRTIYGTFLEHIGRSIFGGLSAQLLDNPSLEHYPARPAVVDRQFSGAAFRESTSLNLPLPWLPLRHAGRRYESRSGHAVNSESYLYVMGLPSREVGIRQTVYLPTERQLKYTGSLFALAAEGAVGLTAAFRRRDKPDDVLASTRLDVPGDGKWHECSFRLEMPAGAVAPLDPVDFAVAVDDGGRISLDEIRLYPADAVDTLDPEVVRLAAELNTPLLRYGGNFSSGYHWEDGVGPLDKRPVRMNEAWGIPEYNEFGTHEFMDFCERIGALPQICLNLGSGSPEEARDWVEYCQGPPNSPQGRRRGANGHAAPWAIGAWEMGNELYDDTQLGWYTPSGYAARYLTFFRAIEPAVGPNTPILATGAELNGPREWNHDLLKLDGGQLSFVTTHLVADLEEVKDRSADRSRVIAADLALPVGVGRRVEEFRRQFDSFPDTRGRVRLAWSEWLFRSPAGSGLPNYDNMGGAVIAAGWFNMLARHADFIPVANMTGLMEFGGIHKDRGRVWVTPQYWVLYLYSHYAGDVALDTTAVTETYEVHGGQVFAPEIADVPFLDVLGTKNSRTGEISLFVVNRHIDQPRAGEITLSGFHPARVRVAALTAASLLAGNDAEHPNAVRPAESEEMLQGSTLRHVFPPVSLTVLRFATHEGEQHARP